ncbi:glycosyltransferase [Geomonas sp. Red32]|uniref:glycosyltransferase n=1 Tax=Geomonas sp. Red32 TaxID=2912856 RepID=UPI00202CCF1A|nr:glycosyltransferase [Geomonas sp. Red32]MCM0084048.1 glycosyltransferase [Geomonas sp. Red32]
MNKVMPERALHVSLITTVYNEGASILDFLQSYLAQTRHANEFVIVDGGSRDDTARFITTFAERNPHLNIRLLVDETCSRKHSVGPIAKGRNVAISHVHNDLIAVTDAGCRLESMWLEEIVRPFSEQEADVVAGWYEPVLGSAFQKAYSRLYLPTLESIDRENFLPSSRSIAFRKEAWARVGGYPEDTYTAEDTMFDIKLREAGFRFYFAEKAVVFWNCPSTLDEATKKHYNYGYGDGQYGFFKKNYLTMLFSLLFPYKYFLKPHYKGARKMAYLINLSLVRGYLKGMLAGAGNK